MENKEFQFIQFVQIENGATIPGCMKNNFCQFNLWTWKSYFIYPKEMIAIDFGIYHIIPDDLFAMIFLKESFVGKYRCIIPNSPFILKSDYTGKDRPIYLTLFNYGETFIHIYPQECVAEMIYIKSENMNFITD